MEDDTDDKRAGASKRFGALSPARRIVAVNAGWLVSDRVVKLGINFVVGILIARYLGPDDFGVLSFGQMLVTLVLPIATFGLPDILLREFSKGQRPPEVVLATAINLRLALSVLAIGIMLASVYVLRGSDRIVLLVAISYGLSLIPQVFDTIETRFQSLDRVGVISTLRMVATVIFGAIRVLAIVLEMDVVTFALLYSGEVLLVAVLSILQARRMGVSVKPTASDGQEARFLLITSFPLMLRLLTISIYMRVDQIVISALLGDRALGVYSVATRIAELWYFIPMSIVVAATPSLTRTYEISQEAYFAALARLLRVMVLISVSAAVVVSVGSQFIVQTLFGDAFREAAPALAIQAWAGVFVAIGVGANPWFINTGQLRFGIYQALAAAMVGIVLNSVLVPRFGLTGAAASMVCSYAVSALLLNAVFPATRPLFILQVKAFLLR